MKKIPLILLVSVVSVLLIFLFLNNNFKKQIFLEKREISSQKENLDLSLSLAQKSGIRNIGVPFL